MPVLPTGTVTFLFTDVEGSTRLLRRIGAAYRDLLAVHPTWFRVWLNELSGDCPHSWVRSVSRSFREEAER
jgi:hypothetical protein